MYLLLLFQIYTLGGFVTGKSKDNKGDQDLKTGIVKLDATKIFQGEVLAIGGEYNTRYAIIA